jgi:hypothetical protein
VIVQRLFGKCAKRNKAQSTPQKRSQEEAESDFKTVSEPEEATERATEEPNACQFLPDFQVYPEL